VPKVDIEINNTATVDDDVVCRYSVNPAERPTIPCRVKAAGIPAEGLAITLTGNKLRFPDVGSTSKVLTLPPNGGWMPFTVSGQTASTAMNDAPVQVRVNGADGDILAAKGMTVLWVDVSMRNTQDAGFSPDNGSVTKPNPPLLGSQILSSFIGHVVELVGTVSPADFTSSINFSRDNIAHYVAIQLVSTNPAPVIFEHINETKDREPNGNDTSNPNYLDLQPTPDGKIYDIDAPGFIPNTNPFPSLSQGTLVFVRCNFKQYAAFNNVRCSNDLDWFVRLTAIKTSPAGTGEYDFHNRPGKNDNLSGTGGTTMSAD
jgi:hypothetical protein